MSPRQLWPLAAEPLGQTDAVNTPSLAAARRAFAAAQVGIDPRTVEFVAGDGASVTYTGSSQVGSTPDVLVLGAGAPRVACRPWDLDDGRATGQR